MEDIAVWKTDMLGRLETWRQNIPQYHEESPQHHMNLLCSIKYHELVMLVLRASPRLQQPDKASLRQCFRSAVDCCKLYRHLYVSKALHYGWISVHSLFLCVMTMFYCVWTPQGVADDTHMDCLTQALKGSSDILSAMGEYWPEATRSRDILDRVSAATFRRFLMISKDRQSEFGSASVICPLLDKGVPYNQLPSSSSKDSGDFSQSTAADPLPQQLSFNSEDMAGEFAPPYRSQDDAFMSADMLSFFLGNSIDSDMTGRTSSSTQQANGGVDNLVASLFSFDSWGDMSQS